MLFRSWIWARRRTGRRKKCMPVPGLFLSSSSGGCLAAKACCNCWLSTELARQQVSEGLMIWDFASDENPDIVMAACGDYPTKETMAAIDIIKTECPAAKGALRSFFRSKFKAPKTPPSHGLTGFGAIKPIAKIAAFFRGRARLPRCAPRLCARRKISPGSSGGPLNQGRMGDGLQRKILFCLTD